MSDKPQHISAVLAHNRRCPTCDAPKGQPCTTTVGNQPMALTVHQARKRIGATRKGRRRT